MKVRRSFLLLSLVLALVPIPAVFAENKTGMGAGAEPANSAHTDIGTATKTTADTQVQAPEVINNAKPTKIETRATEIKNANPESMEYGFLPKLRSFSSGESKFRVKKVDQRKTMALALGGGGVRGAAHVGVLRVLEQEKIPIDYIVGNSMGAVVGGLYAAGVGIDKLMDEARFTEFRKAYVPTLSAKALKVPLSVLWAPFRTGPIGVMSGHKYQVFLEKQVPPGKEKIESLNIPFSAVVTNLLDGQAYRISEGDLATAMRASSTLVPLLRSVAIGDKLCADGGVRANLPASAARDTGADVVIAVLVDDSLQSVTEKQLRHYRAVTERLTDIVLAVTDEHQLQFADIVISPDVRGISIFAKKKADIRRAIEAGETAARKALPLIRKKMNLPAETKLSETSRSQ